MTLGGGSFSGTHDRDTRLARQAFTSVALRMPIAQLG